MSIGNFVESSFQLLNSDQYAAALSLACAAVDATAAKTEDSNLNNNRRYKSFLNRNMRIVIEFGFLGISAQGIRIGCKSIPDIKTDENGRIGIEDIIYHVIRCGLIHQCEIDQRIEFVNNTFIGDFDSKFRVPSSIIVGLLMAVVLNESNKNESIKESFIVSIKGKKKKLNDLWGNKNIYY